MHILKAHSLTCISKCFWVNGNSWTTIDGKARPFFSAVAVPMSSAATCDLFLFVFKFIIDFVYSPVKAPLITYQLPSTASSFTMTLGIIFRLLLSIATALTVCTVMPLIRAVLTE